MKTCPKCKKPKENSEFCLEKRAKPRCKNCRYEYNKKYYWKNKSLRLVAGKKWRKENYEYIKTRQKLKYDANTQAYRERRLLREYGISLREWDERMLSQGGMCAVCSGESKLVVDHDHKTGKIRGLLCGSCNRGIGLFKDSAAIARAVAKYLDVSSE